MDVFTVMYLLAGALLLGTEFYCIVTRNKQTVSHKTVRWMKGNPKVRRIVVIAFLVWLTWHIGWEYF